MGNNEILPELIISSYANRAFHTAQIIAKKIGFPEKDIKIDRSIYSSSIDNIFRFVPTGTVLLHETTVCPDFKFGPISSATANTVDKSASPFSFSVTQWEAFLPAQISSATMMDQAGLL